MDILTGQGAPGEARLRYLDADFEVVKPGRFVVCAVTKKKIPLEDLRYWCVESQEAYFDAAAAYTQWKRRNGYADKAE